MKGSWSTKRDSKPRFEPRNALGVNILMYNSTFLPNMKRIILKMDDQFLPNDVSTQI